MSRITISCNEVTSNELKWLCETTMRKPSNLLALLITREVNKQMADMDEADRAAVFARLCPDNGRVLSRPLP